MHDSSDISLRNNDGSQPEPPGELFELSSATSPSNPNPPATAINETADFAQRRPLSILVVDDNDINRKVVGAILDQLGYRYAEASSGEAAIEAVEGTDFDYLFTDLDMPGMSGIESTEAIRDREAKSNSEKRMEIVAITANISPDTRLRCRRAGMNGFLEKPITSQMIKEQLLRSWNRIRPKAT